MNDTSAVLKLLGWAVLIIGVIGGLGGAFLGGGGPLFPRRSAGIRNLLCTAGRAWGDHPPAGPTGDLLPAVGGGFGTAAARGGTTRTRAAYLRKMRHPAPPWWENLPHLPPCE